MSKNSNKNKLKAQTQPPPTPKPVGQPAPPKIVSQVKVHMLSTGDPCEDELLALHDTMYPLHRKFAGLFLSGIRGAEAARMCGQPEGTAKNWAFRALRREDVRRYMKLQHQLSSRTEFVTLNTVKDKLYRAWCDPSQTLARRDSSRDQLVRILMAGTQDPGFLLDRSPTLYGDREAAKAKDAGLTKIMAEDIECKILGIAPPPEEPQE
jgi:hypothetical protein